VLHLVDFDQLKIENQQYLERIDAKNRELLQLKLSTGRTVQVGTASRQSVLLMYATVLSAYQSSQQENNRQQCAVLDMQYHHSRALRIAGLLQVHRWATMVFCILCAAGLAAGAE
jgi:hypothetical protein